MHLEGLGFVKTLATFGINNATDAPLQNMTKTVCLLFHSETSYFVHLV